VFQQWKWQRKLPDDDKAPPWCLGCLHIIVWKIAMVIKGNVLFMTVYVWKRWHRISTEFYDMTEKCATSIMIHSFQQGQSGTRRQIQEGVEFWRTNWLCIKGVLYQQLSMWSSSCCSSYCELWWLTDGWRWRMRLWLWWSRGRWRLLSKSKVQQHHWAQMQSEVRMQGLW